MSTTSGASRRPRAPSRADRSGWQAGRPSVGRTSILTLSNPTAVTAQVSLQIFGEEGAVEAPGLLGIEVQPGAQRVLSLAGFAPGLVSPIVHVEARGGQVVAYLQQSIVRGLDASGVDLVDAAPDPATDLTFPGVRIFDAVGTSRPLVAGGLGRRRPGRPRAEYGVPRRRR